MQYIFTGKNINITAALKEAAIQKIDKLDKYFEKEITAQVTMVVEKKSHIIEVTIPVKGSIIRAEEEAENMYAAIDLVIDVLERQLLKYKNKLSKKHRNQGTFKAEFLQKNDDVADEGSKIVRNKKFPIKPMDVDEACMEMDLLGHDFFVFRNADSNEVNVVYKRKNGDYGLIDPEY
jgi:putative sigma-54 modulation protein